MERKNEESEGYKEGESINDIIKCMYKKWITPNRTKTHKNIYKY